MDKYIDNGELTAVGESVVGQVRSANEDFCGYLSTVNGELFVVCDGMGGHVGGAEASKTAVSYIIKTLAEQQYDDIAVAIHNALITANRAVYEKGRMNPALAGMGTTACVLVVRDGKAWIAHVGDSRIYLFTARDKTLHRITKDHSFVQSQVDLGLLDDRDAENHPRKNVILKALGIREELNVDVAQMPVLPSDGDVFLICSDGLSGMIDDTYIEDVLANNPDVETALGILIDSANAPGKGTDNITTQLIKIKGVQREQSEFVDYNPLWRRQAIVNMPTLDFGDNTPVMPVPKKKKSKAWIWILLGIIGLLILVGAGTWAFFSLKDRNKNTEPTLEEQIEQLNAEINNMNIQKASLENRFKEIQEDIKSLDNEVQSAKSYIQELKDTPQESKNALLADWEAELKTMRDDSTKVQSEIESLKSRLKEKESQLQEKQKEANAAKPGNNTSKEGGK